MCVLVLEGPGVVAVRWREFSVMVYPLKPLEIFEHAVKEFFVFHYGHAGWTGWWGCFVVVLVFGVCLDPGAISVRPVGHRIGQTYRIAIALSTKLSLMFQMFVFGSLR
ncbi:hypothetical protein B0T14DRAFT_148254 [Immersiella caudata]|uniref:Uncharacterized protein n=1 Tax=Immersiella caudata TaxID=314043 RepID=A0AA40C2B8_9PEZI|nr:hypothetical protein B0T14DRAFT_148254 [Immersiella caudata]